MKRAALVLLILAFAVGYGWHSHRPVQTLSHDVYLWQRVWTPALFAAYDDLRPHFRQARVLLLTVTDGRAYPTRLPEQVADLRPVRAVIRVNGVELPEAAQARAEIDQAIARWESAGWTVDSLEVDHDSPTGKLHRYADWLAVLTDGMERSVTVTVLPDWLGDSGFARLLGLVSGYTLQVHATDLADGLMDPGKALAWAERADALGVRFDVALPTYWYAARRDQAGQVDLLDAESAVPVALPERLFIAPPTLQQFQTDLGRMNLVNLRAVVWFRLPTVADSRAFRPETLRLLITGEALSSRTRLDLVPLSQHTADLYLTNAGNVEQLNPSQLMLPGNCAVGDLTSLYELESNSGLVRASQRVLRANERVRIGWVRCKELGVPNA